MNLERLNEINITHIVKHDVVPALGCTELISIASATAAKYLGKTPGMQPKYLLI